MFTFEGKHIPSIYEIPKDCKLILLSEKVVETEREDGLEKAFVTGVDPELKATEPSLKSHYTLEQHQILGLKNNIYQNMDIKSYKH